MRVEIDTESPFYIGAVEAGFEFGKFIYKHDNITDIYSIYGVFTCVCGKEEKYAAKVSYADVMPVNKSKTTMHFKVCRNSLCETCLYIDVALLLCATGSFSYEHLIEDGYTESDARKIRDIVMARVA